VKGEAVHRKMKLVEIRRRDILVVGATTVAAVGSASWVFAQRGGDMYGLIGKMTAAPGKRDELISILLEGAASMPGCLSYIVAKDAGNADAIWIQKRGTAKPATMPRYLCRPSKKPSRRAGR
jgi:hypothetical protein